MTEKKRSPVIAPIYHAGFSALLTPGSAAVNAGYGHSLAGVGMGRMLLPSLNSCFAATHVISFKDKQDGSRARLILKMDFAVRWHGSERVGGRREHQTHCLHKHVSECAHTCTHVLSSKTCAAACHSPGSAALHKSNLLQSPVQCWEFFSQVWWTLELLFQEGGGCSNFIQTTSLWQC